MMVEWLLMKMLLCFDIYTYFLISVRPGSLILPPALLSFS